MLDFRIEFNMCMGYPCIFPYQLLANWKNIQMKSKNELEKNRGKVDP
jgi:hypothetical protein